jgi:endonuclease-8
VDPRSRSGCRCRGNAGPQLLLANANLPQQSTTGELARCRQHWVLERGGKPCRRCGAKVISTVQGDDIYA